MAKIVSLADVERKARAKDTFTYFFLTGTKDSRDTWKLTPYPRRGEAAVQDIVNTGTALGGGDLLAVYMSLYDLNDKDIAFTMRHPTLLTKDAFVDIWNYRGKPGACNDMLYR